MMIREKYKKYSKIFKRVTALVLVVALLPLRDISQADIRNTLKNIYADDTKVVENQILQLTGDVGKTGNVELSWKKPDDAAYIYRIFKNDVMIAETEEISYNDGDTGAGEEYRYQIKVYRDGEDINQVKTVSTDAGDRDEASQETKEDLCGYGISNVVTIQMPEALVIDGKYTLDKKMKVYNLDIKSGCLDLNGYELEVCRDVKVDGKIKFNKGTLLCNSDIVFGKDASCSMRNSADSLKVSGKFIDSVYTRENKVCFENGTLHIYGDFKVNNGMEFNSSCLVNFFSDNKQTIDCKVELPKVRISNFGQEGVFIIGDFKYGNLDSNSCQITYIEREKNYVSDWVLSEDQTIEDDLYITDGTLNLNGHTLTVKENLEFSGGEINLCGGTLKVEGSMTFTEGTLNVNHSSLIVEEDFNYGIYDYNAGEAFNNGCIRMLSEDDDIKVGNTLTIYAGENAELNAGNISVSGSLDIEGNLEFSNHIRAGYCRNDNGILTVSGTLEIDSYGYGSACGIVMNKGRIICYEYFGAGGMVSPLYGLQMTNPEDYICVYGNFVNDGFANEDYTVQNGTLEIKGEYSDIRAYGDSTVLLSGDVAQTIWGTCAKVEVRNSSIYGVNINSESGSVEYFDTPVSYKGIELKQGWTLTSDTVIEGDMGIWGGTLDLNGYTLTVTGSFCHFGGSINLNGGRLNICGDYRMVQGNYEEPSEIIMENFAEYILIGGNFDIAQNMQCILTDGVFEIKGDITGEGIFCSENNNRVLLSGENEQEGSKDGNRVKHVLKHTVPNNSKPLHTVYNVDKSEVLGLVDEAWMNRGQGVLQSNGNVLYDINMGRIIGTNGEDTIRIITKGYSNNIVTAFPRGKGVN